jgi:hypothetical protein
VLRDIRSGREGVPPRVTERRAALAELGLAEAATDALAQMSLDDRAALIAGTVEGLELADVATVLGRDLGATRRSLRAARAKYLAVAEYWLRGTPVPALPGGEISHRVDEAVIRTIGYRPAEVLLR